MKPTNNNGAGWPCPCNNPKEVICASYLEEGCAHSTKEQKTSIVMCEWVNCRFNDFHDDGGHCTQEKVYIYLHNGDAKCIQKDIDEGKFPK